jgi:Zn-dependent protease with chaperone function
MLRTTRTPMTQAAATAIALLSSVSLLIGQTQIVAPENKYNISEDVKAGREAAQQVEEQLPILNDSQVQSYVSNIGARLAESIPREFQHPEFHYTFKVVNVSDINAFALPGGPMYVNRGMIEAAKTEGEVAGVMAHEMSHVALRHGTAQAGKATKYEVGSVLGQIAGAVLGGTLGQVVSYGTQFGLGTAFSRFSREYEKQADILGSHIMASAGYDPRDMANMFKTIEKISGNGGPQWMSDHPNPSNRYQYINDEANMLRVTNPIRDTRAFVDVQNRLRRMPPAPTTEQAAKQQGGNRRTSQGGRYPGGSQVGRVDPPSAQMSTYDEGNLFRISVPANWQELPSNTTVTFAPQGGYGDFQGQSVFTHGVEVGTSRNESHDLRTATDELVSSLSQSNPQLQGRSSYNSITIAGRRGLHTVLNNVSDVTRQPEQIELFTAQLTDGTLFYLIGVAPANEFSTYQRVFNQVVRSIQLNSGYSNSRY